MVRCISATAAGWAEMRKKALPIRAQRAHSAVGFLELKLRQLAGEFAAWKAELSEEDYRAVLREIVTFTGTVPLPPDALLPHDEKSGLPIKLKEKTGNLPF
jgi:hypothetical protein